MNNRQPAAQQSHSFAVVMFAVLSIFFATQAQAQYACAEQIGDKAGKNPYDNPCPAPDDIVMPIPGGNLVMAFRTVSVPGKGFWSDPARNVELGDPDARIFEGPRLVSVSGSFKDSRGEGWRILIGKYELTVAQFAAIVGDSDLRAGIETLVRDSAIGSYYARILDDDTDGLEKRRMLASPVRGLRAGVLEAVAQRYTDWCYTAPECLAALPSFGAMPGFFRLPTEIEWEYSARRHSAADERVSVLPFDPNETTDYAYVSTSTRERDGPTMIGRFTPTEYGVHDLYGNVTELVDGRFYAELGQGKPGMYISRGESYAYSLISGPLRPSRRAEVQDYRREDDGRIVPLKNIRLGVRFAIGSHTVPDLQTLAELEISYANYRSTDRLRSASGQSTRADALVATEPLDAIDRLIEEYRVKSNLPEALQKELVRLTESARLNLRRTSESIAYELVKRAGSLGAEIGRYVYRARDARRRSAMFSDNLKDNMIAQAEAYERQQRAALTEYADAIVKLASYRQFSLVAIDEYANRVGDGLLSASMPLVQKHTSEVLNGDSDTSVWGVSFAEAFQDDELFKIER